MAKKKQKTKNRPLLLAEIFLLAMVILSAILVLVGYQKQNNLHFPDKLQEGFKRVKDLRIGDLVYVKEGEELKKEKIVGIKKHFGPQEAYNLKMEDGPNTFFANNFAVHNKFASHDAVCDVTLAPRLSTAPTETWNISNKGQAFKNLFQRSGTNWGPFQDDGGNKVCFWGSVINGCQYPPTRVLPRYWDSDAEKYRCDYRVTPCCGCDNSCGTNCDCLSGSTYWCRDHGCEMTCGPWGTGHAADSNQIRFRSAFLFCDGCGCGSAIKVTPPSGYVIKSITADVTSRMADYSDPNIHGHLYFSRGMSWTLECPMSPRVDHYTVPSVYDGRLTVDLGRGTRYFFIYLGVTSAGVDEGNWVGVDLRDNWAELSNIELKLVKIDEVTGREVTIINNSLQMYDGVNVNNLDLSSRWPTIQNGLIEYSDYGSNWTAAVDVNSSWAKDWTLPAGPEGSRTVWVRVTPTSSGGGAPAICPETIYYRAPNFPPDCNTLTGVEAETIQGEILNLTATVSDTDGTVSKVEFYYTPYPQANYCTASWTKIGEDTNGADGWSTSWDTAGVDEGDYYVVANVYDDKNAWCTGNPSGTCGVANSACSDCRRTTTIKFIADAWYQTQEGDVHGQLGVSSLIPKTCEENPLVCDPNYSLPGVGDFWGIVSHNGSANFGEYGYPSNSEANHWLASGTLMQSQSFAYFYQLLGLPDTDEFDTLDLGSLPSDTDGDGVYYSDGDVTIKGDLSGDTKVIVLVNGKIDITENVTVPVDNSLVVIASGDIIIADSVDQVEGIYVADGTISTGAGDTEFFGYGSFIAGSFDLRRDFTATNPDDERNNTTPVEHFIYRPDLIINSPTKLWAAPLNWQELPP